MSQLGNDPLNQTSLPHVRATSQGCRLYHACDDNRNYRAADCGNSVEISNSRGAKQSPMALSSKLNQHFLIGLQPDSRRLVVSVFAQAFIVDECVMGLLDRLPAQTNLESYQNEAISDLLVPSSRRLEVKLCETHGKTENRCFRADFYDGRVVNFTFMEVFRFFPTTSRCTKPCAVPIASLVRLEAEIQPHVSISCAARRILMTNN